MKKLYSDITSPAELIERHHPLKREDDEAPEKENGIEDQQSVLVLLPIHRSAVEASLEPTENWQRTILSIHDPGYVLEE
jgi:hypothetical protein